MDVIHFVADKRGIFCIDPIDYLERELIRVDKFLSSLDSLEPGELIFTGAVAGSDEFDMIKKHIRGV